MKRWLMFAAALAVTVLLAGSAIFDAAEARRGGGGGGFRNGGGGRAMVRHHRQFQHFRGHSHVRKSHHYSSKQHNWLKKSQGGKGKQHGGSNYGQHGGKQSKGGQHGGKQQKGGYGKEQPKQYVLNNKNSNKNNNSNKNTNKNNNSAKSVSKASVGDITVNVGGGGGGAPFDVTSLIGLISTFHQANPGVPIVQRYVDQSSGRHVDVDTRECECVERGKLNAERLFKAIEYREQCIADGRWISYKDNPALKLDERCTAK